MHDKSIITFVLAGGKGERLLPLTRDRAKPAVPFGGAYRIIDFTLSNCVNSGLRRIHALVQYKSHSLQRHLRLGWNIFDIQLGEYIDVVPAQQRVGDDWYRGTADAIYQNMYNVLNTNSKEVLILAGDHIYKMDYAEMIDFHEKNNADMTVATVRMPREEMSKLGVIEVDRDGRITGFQEKPKDAKGLPDDPDMIFGSMGIYIFNTQVLIEELSEDAKKNTDHDFGKNIIPQMVKKNRKLMTFDFKDKDTAKPSYWRDIGTIDAYYEANMDLVKVNPDFNLYDKDWPIRTYHEPYPPAKTLHIGEEEANRVGLLLNSLVTSGCIISGGKVQRSILSYSVKINSYSEVYDSILMEGVNVSRYAKIKRAIVDKDVNIPPGMVIGYDLDLDRKRFTVTDSGIVVVAKKTELK